METWNAKEIREFRKQNGLTQQRLADLIGVTSRSVYYYERGLREPGKPTKMLLSRVQEDLQKTKGEGGEKT